MSGAIRRIWGRVSHVDTALSMLDKLHWAASGLISGVAMLTAWLREIDPIWVVVIGVALFALFIFIFERLSAWRWRKQQGAGEFSDVSAPQTFTDPIYEAVEYVINKIDDCDSNNCYPSARHALRQAAYTGKIQMYGKRELKKGYHSDLRTQIPQEFWDDQELNSLSTSDAYVHHEHSAPEHADGFQKIGSDREKYWDIRINMCEIKALWP